MCIRDSGCTLLEEAGNGKDGVAHADFRYTVRAAVCFGGACLFGFCLLYTSPALCPSRRTAARRKEVTFAAAAVRMELPCLLYTSPVTKPVSFSNV